MAVGDWWSVSSSVYRHHFIEVFHGKVVHLFDEAKLQRLASVRIDAEFVATRGRCKKLHGSGGVPAALMAMSRIGDAGYHLAFNNCEHFARWCTTGEHRSEQVESVVKGMRAGFVVGCGTSLVAGAATYILGLGSGSFAALAANGGSIGGMAVGFTLLTVLPFLGSVGMSLLALRACNR